MPTDQQTELMKRDAGEVQQASNETSNSILAVIARAASDPSVDIEKMDRLLQMQERIMAKQAEVQFAEAMHKAQGEMPRVINDSRNNQTNSNYAKLATVNDAIVPIYSKHGFSLSYGEAESKLPDHRRITCRVTHAAGHSRDYYLDLPLDIVGIKGSANKTAIHGFGSTISYGRRYLALMIFNVSTGDDNDGNAKDEGKSVTELRDTLWKLLAPVRGEENNWKVAQQFLWDEVCMDLDVTVAKATAAQLAGAIERAKEKLGGAK